MGLGHRHEVSRSHTLLDRHEGLCTNIEVGDNLRLGGSCAACRYEYRRAQVKVRWRWHRRFLLAALVSLALLRTLALFVPYLGRLIGLLFLLWLLLWFICLLSVAHFALNCMFPKFNIIYTLLRTEKAVV